MSVHVCTVEDILFICSVSSNCALGCHEGCQVSSITIAAVTCSESCYSDMDVLASDGKGKHIYKKVEKHAKYDINHTASL